MALPPPIEITLAPELQEQRFELLCGGRTGGPEYTYIGAVAVRLGIERSEVLALIRSGSIDGEEHPDWPGVWRIRQGDLEQFLDSM